MAKPAEATINPTIQEAKVTLDSAVRKHRAVLLVGRCAVIYAGRAESQLTDGDRIIIIKEDGALLVHRPRGYEPVNWMPGGDVVYHIGIVDPRKERKLKGLTARKYGQAVGSGAPEGAAHNSILQIRAVRRRPSESVALFFDSIYLISSLRLVDSGEFSLYASEEDMQKAVLLEPSLIEAEFRPISYEKKVKPGFIDIYGIDKDGNLVVVEIKRKTAGRDAALQLAKYVESVRSAAGRNVRGILAAPHMGKEAQKMLATLGLDFKTLTPKKCAEILSRVETRKLVDFFED